MGCVFLYMDGWVFLLTCLHRGTFQPHVKLIDIISTSRIHTGRSCMFGGLGEWLRRWAQMGRFYHPFVGACVCYANFEGTCDVGWCGLKRCKPMSHFCCDMKRQTASLCKNCSRHCRKSLGVQLQFSLWMFSNSMSPQLLGRHPCQGKHGNLCFAVVLAWHGIFEDCHADGMVVFQNL